MARYPREFDSISQDGAPIPASYESLLARIKGVTRISTRKEPEVQIDDTTPIIGFKTVHVKKGERIPDYSLQIQYGTGSFFKTAEDCHKQIVKWEKTIAVTPEGQRNYRWWKRSWTYSKNIGIATLNCVAFVPLFTHESNELGEVAP